MKHPSLFFAIIFLASMYSGFSQSLDSTSAHSKNGITKPNILSVHPFGIFFSRLQGNFKLRATKKTTFNISLESGNVWASPVRAYIPNERDIRTLVKNVPWHGTQFAFDYESLNAKTIIILFDGVIKSMQTGVNFKIRDNQELNIGIRSYLLTKGKFPFTSITNDGFIEFFHSNIAGGDDPFGRKLFGLDKANIFYKDRNDKVLSLSNGDFFIGGVQTNYYYYPEQLINGNKTFFMNFGAHVGTNLSKYNSSMDIGLTANAIALFNINKKNYSNLGLSIGSVKKNVVEFKQDNLDFGNNRFIAYLESAIEYSFVSKSDSTHSFGFDFYYQTRLNKKEEFDYSVPIRNGVTEKAWVTGLSHLYKNNNYCTVYYSFTGKTTTTFYLQQDLNLNNNPDLQTGINFSFKL